MMNELMKFTLTGLFLLLALGQICTGQTGNSKEEVGKRSADNETKKLKLRTWKDSSGKFELVARFARQDGETVFLERENGKRVRVPLERLSKPDQDYIRDLQADNPFQDMAELQAPASAASLVVVAIDDGGNQQLKTGYVYRKTEDFAFVAVPAAFQNLGRVYEQGMPRLGNQKSGKENDTEIKYKVFTFSPERHEIKAKRVTEFYKTRTLILSVPAAEMPDPIEFDLRKLRKGDEVNLVGYEFDYSGRQPSFFRAVKMGIVSNVFEDVDGNVGKLQIEAEDAANVNGGLAISQDGIVLGVNQIRSNRDAMFMLDIAPYDLLANLENPEFSSIRIAAKAGDREKIEYQLVVEIADPFRKIETAKLLVKPMLPNERSTNPSVANNRNQQPEPLEDAEEVELKIGELDKVVRRQLALQPVSPGGELPAEAYVADFTTENTGPLRDYRFQMQLVYSMRDSELIYGVPAIITYSPQRLRDFRRVRGNNEDAKSVVPDIPGFDGRPLDMPRIEALTEGGWKLTSAMTAVTTRMEHTAKDFPAPEETGVSAVAKVNQLDDIDAMHLNILSQAENDHSRSRAPMAFSGEGDYLYIVDAGNVLRKTRTEDLVEEAKLEIGAKCDEVVYSKAGIVLALNSAGVVWVVDEKTLKVKFEIPVEGVRLLAANPTTSIGFAEGGLLRGKNSESTSPALFMLDLDEGQIIHRLKSHYGGDSSYYQLTVDNNVKPIGERNMNLQMSSDGKYFYSADGQIRRFHVDGRELVFEEVGNQLVSGHTTHFVLSVDGKWTALPTGGGNGSGYNIYVFDTQDLKKKKLDLANGAYPCAIGFDPVSKMIYSPNHDEMNIFTDKGGKQSSFKHKLNDPRRIIVHPKGERFVTWAQNRIVYYDLNQQRTAPRVEADAEE